MTAAASGFTKGGEDAKSEKMMQNSTITAPSKQTAQQLLINDLPIFCEGSPAKVDRGIDASAVYIEPKKSPVHGHYQNKGHHGDEQPSDERDSP